MMSDLYYVHDPMCSWCWAFRPVWQALQTILPGDIAPRRVLGGLAEDSDEPMPAAMRVTLEQTWRRIQQRVPACTFNFDFWLSAEPRRSTWPACRAVLAAEQQDAAAGEKMILAIQRAYYLQARNPSERPVLIELAEQIGLDARRFERDLDSKLTRGQLRDEINLGTSLGVSSFPSLVLDQEGSRWPVEVNYESADKILDQLVSIREVCR